MDSWYASMKVMKAIEHLSKIYYVPLKRNRLVNDTDGVKPHQQVRDLSWTQTETQQGKRVHINKFPKGHQVKLFRIASSNGHTEYIATNDISQSDADATVQECQNTKKELRNVGLYYNGESITPNIIFSVHEMMVLVSKWI